MARSLPLEAVLGAFDWRARSLSNDITFAKRAERKAAQQVF
jgi:hypothetical protein